MFPIDYKMYNLVNSKNNQRKGKFGEGKEAIMIREEIGDFNINSSDAMKLIKEYFGDSLRISEIKGIINATRDYLSQKNINLPKLTRNENRNFQLCIKYIQNNIEIFKKIIPFIQLGDNQGRIIL
ncbi:hypothetical protein M9Y10_009197 [Tritrichomonas musculus]|uniref:Uncharacterized protein n=1 Tax=Tritrichomonas musculus TaxID=1915356 RepID=A0ABR2INK6_9EUKA